MNAHLDLNPYRIVVIPSVLGGQMTAMHLVKWQPGGLEGELPLRGTSFLPSPWQARQHDIDAAVTVLVPKQPNLPPPRHPSYEVDLGP